MKYSKVILTAIAGFLSTAQAASDVVQLTGDKFDDFLSDNGLVLAEFYAPWCGHCKALAPEYETAATNLKDKGIKLAKIDCTEEESLCAEQKIQGYPTLKVFKGPEKVSPYAGARKADSIESYMVRQSMPAVSEVTAENIEDFKSQDNFVTVAFFDDKKANSTFQNVAEKLNDKYLFGSSNDLKLAKKYGVSKFPALVGFKNFEGEGEKAVYDSSEKNFKFDEENIKTFIVQESFPLIGEIGPQTFSDYATSGIPLLYIFADNDEDKEELSEIAKELAPKLKGKANIGVLDAKLYGGHAPNVNLEEGNWPALAIQDFVNSKKFTHPQDGKGITKKSFTKFVEDFASGKLEPSVRSAPIPDEKDQGPVYTVVGKNYDDLVLNNDKDVLVEFYAPWCGHCKNLAPIYEQLGGLYYNDSDFSKKVTVAQVDHTANDVPDDIMGYPTLKLFPAGKKSEPIEFEGSRTLEGLANFIKENGKHKVDGLVNQKKEDDEADKKDDKKKADKKKDGKKKKAEDDEEPKEREEL